MAEAVIINVSIPHRKFKNIDVLLNSFYSDDVFPSLIGSSKTIPWRRRELSFQVVSIPHRKFKNGRIMSFCEFIIAFPSLIGSSKTLLKLRK